MNRQNIGTKEIEMNMNSLWLSNIEILMEERRADFRREMETLRLEREALTTGEQSPTWFQRKLQGLSLWLIATGERLNRNIQDPVPVPRWYQSFKVAR